MRKHFLFAIFLMSVSCAPKQDNLSATGNFIIGGTSTNDEIGKVTVQIGIQFTTSSNEKFSSGCTGVILKENLILTAAHCFDSGRSDILRTKVYLSFSTLEALQPAPAGFWAESYAVNEDYLTSKDPSADIAIIRFSTPMPLGYKSAKLSINSSDFADADSFIAVGYGFNNALTKTNPDQLQQVKLDLLETRGDWGIILKQDDYRGLCMGDSGGPVFVKTSDSELKLVAINIMSSGVNGKICNSKGMILRIDYSWNFISQYLN